MYKVLLFILLCNISALHSQTLSGIISDDLSKPLESANIIAKPLQENASLKFAISGNKSLFKMKT